MAPGSFGFDDTVVSVPGETGLRSAAVSGRCTPPHCVLLVAAWVAAPSRFASLPLLLVALLPDLQ